MTYNILTGNEYISLPTINESGDIFEFTFLSMKRKGLIDVTGNEHQGFMNSKISVDGKELNKRVTVNRIKYWIPEISYNDNNVLVKNTILTPNGHKGFINHYNFTNNENNTRKIELTIFGIWDETIHRINTTKKVDMKKIAYLSRWFKSPVFDLSNGFTEFSIAFLSNDAMKMDITQNDNKINYSLTFNLEIAPNSTLDFDLFVGLGQDEISAVTASQELQRQTYSSLYSYTTKWLEDRIQKKQDKRIEELANINLFFNFFFAAGITYDSEEMVLVTSRSPKYYVSSAYWDRDSMLWSIPSIVIVDSEYAKKMLEYVFTKQIRNVGTHSRFIDGTVLEPGFELDELIAPIIALNAYVEKTNDTKFLLTDMVKNGVNIILDKLLTKQAPNTCLFETFLYPSDDMHTYKYLTYDNALVYKGLVSLVKLYKDYWDKDRIDSIFLIAQKLHNSIEKECIKEVDGKKMYVWSVDLNGHYKIYDEPPGSLELLAYYDFVDEKDEVYLNTINYLRRKENKFSFYDCYINELGCEHAKHPWILSLINSILCNRTVHAREIIKKLKMDNDIACETVDEHTGIASTGYAFATCAGFFAYALVTRM